MKKLISLIVVLFVLSVSAFAGSDNFNVGTIIDLRRSLLSSYSNACAYYETADQVTYVFKATWVDSSDHLHSKPFYIGDCNAVDGYTLTVTSAASDVNPVFHFSYDDCNTWVTTTPATLDAVSNTAVGDTIGIEAGTNDAKFHSANWLVIEYQDGSTALNDGEYCTMVLTFQKDGTYVPGYPAPSVQRIRTRSVTNP